MSNGLLIPKTNFNSFNSVAEALASPLTPTFGLIIFIIPENKFYFWDGFTYVLVQEFNNDFPLASSYTNKIVLIKEVNDVYPFRKIARLNLSDGTNWTAVSSDILVIDTMTGGSSIPSSWNAVLTVGNTTGGLSAIISDSDFLYVGSAFNGSLYWSGTSTVLKDTGTGDGLTISESSGGIILNSSLGLVTISTNTNYASIIEGSGVVLSTNSDNAIVIISQLTNEIGLSTIGNINLDGLTITLPQLTASTVPYINASNVLVSSSVTPTILSYLDATSSIQTQLNSKLAIASFTDTAVTSKLLTGYVSGAGVISGADSILTAIEKLNGNIGTIVSGVSSVNGASGTVVITVTGTTNRITVTGGTSITPTIDISSSYIGQNTITTLGTVSTGTWQGTSISTTYTDAKIKTVTGTLNRLTIGGTSTDPTFDISVSYIGQSTITTLGTITTGVWNGTAITNVNLANSSTTINGITIALGASGTITANVTNALSVDNSSLQLDSGTTFNGSAARTISVKALGITNAMLAGSIAYSKLILTNSVVSGDIVSLVWSKITSTPTTLSGYGITDAQPLSTNLTSLSGLTYVSTSFVKMTAAGTFALDTNTYLTSSTGVTSVTGTTNRITSSGGTTPSIDISSSYVGQTSITTLGTITTGTWNATIIGAVYGGTGIANNVANTITFSGNFGLTLTLSNTTSVTLPTAGTLSTLAGSETFTNKVSYNGLIITANTGVVTTGTWRGTIIETAYGGTGVDNSTGGTANTFWARPNGATGAATYRAIVSADIPTLNQNTTGSAASLSISGQTGLLTFTGLLSTSRIKTIRDAADTILELGGSYTPTGTWTSMILVNPTVGTQSPADNSTKAASTAYVDALYGDNLDFMIFRTMYNY